MNQDFDEINKRLQKDGIDFISALIREGEKTANAFKDALNGSNNGGTSNRNGKDSSQNYDFEKFKKDLSEFNDMNMKTLNQFVTDIKNGINSSANYTKPVDTTSQEVTNTDANDDTTPKESSTTEENSSYECPFPQGEGSAISTEDILSASSIEPDSSTSNTTITEEDTQPKDYSLIDDDAFNKIDPFSAPVEDDTTSIDTAVTPKSEPKPTVSDSEIIEKTSNMWKYQKILSSVAPYKETIAKKGSTTYANILASTVRGKKHKHNGTNCDDYFDFNLVGNSCIVAISDGAGSKPYSRIGAKAATESFTRTMSTSLEALLKDASFLEGISCPINDIKFNNACSKLALELQNSVKSAYSNLECAYNSISKDLDYLAEVDRDLTINDLSCTLIGSVIVPVLNDDGSKDTFVATIQIGDGLAISINQSADYDHCVKVLGSADKGNFGGETEFITSANVLEQYSLIKRIKIMKGTVSSIILATDGVADDYFPYQDSATSLYYDLKLNGVVPVSTSSNDSFFKIVPPIKEQSTIEETPKTVYVAYSEDIKKFFNVDDQTLWKDSSFIENAVSVYSQCYNNDRLENLKTWLDNYTKRGSFDDRTLFIYTNID